jgi:hypothetical protein
VSPILPRSGWPLRRGATSNRAAASATSTVAIRLSRHCGERQAVGPLPATTVGDAGSFARLSLSGSQLNESGAMSHSCATVMADLPISAA